MILYNEVEIWGICFLNYVFLIKNWFKFVNLNFIKGNYSIISEVLVYYAGMSTGTYTLNLNA